MREQDAKMFLLNQPYECEQWNKKRKPLGVAYIIAATSFITLIFPFLSLINPMSIAVGMIVGLRSRSIVGGIFSGIGTYLAWFFLYALLDPLPVRIILAIIGASLCVYLAVRSFSLPPATPVPIDINLGHK